MLVLIWLLLGFLNEALNVGILAFWYVGSFYRELKRMNANNYGLKYNFKYNRVLNVPTYFIFLNYLTED